MTPGTIRAAVRGLAQRMGGTRVGVLVIGWVISPLQRRLYRRTAGRLSLTGRAPVLLLTTTGRRTGKARTVPLFYLRDGDRIVICNVDPGFERPNPWILNLRAKPRAAVQIGRDIIPVRARPVSGSELDRYWPRLAKLWPAYQTFYARGGKRSVFVLEPDSPDREGTTPAGGGPGLPRPEVAGEPAPGGRSALLRLPAQDSYWKEEASSGHAPRASRSAGVEAKGTVVEPVIVVDGLTKRYGGTAVVDGVSFEVGRGEIFGILGRNGAGKTTTVECLQGLRHADRGRMRVLGLDPLTQAAELRRRIGSQLQESALPQRIKVWEALRWFASFAPGARDPGQLMRQWGLEDKRDTYFSDLSGGQRQRLFIALALVNDPELVFLDEMTTGLDPAARHTAWDLVRAVREAGTSVVLVTHFMEEAERLCDRVAVLERGKIVALGAPGALIAEHTRQITVRFSARTGELGWLAAVHGVAKVAQRDGSFEVLGSGPVLAEVAAALVGHGIRPADLRADQPNLEDVFLAITGRRSDE